MINTTNTIRFRFVNGGWALQNKPYQVYIKNSERWVEVYNGLTFFNFNGYSDIYLDPILRDLIFRWETEYFDDQLFRPINYIDDIENTIIEPIELNQHTFMTSYVKVIVKGEGGEQLEQIKEVTGAYSSFYETEKYYIINPYNTNLGAIYQNISLYTKVIPHIPNVSTNKFWLGLNISCTAPYNDLPLFLKRPRQAMEIKKDKYGNYAMAYSLKSLKEKLGYDEKGTTILLSDNPNILTRNDQAVAVVDKCNAPFYVAYTTNYGWNSIGFGGNTYEDFTDENVKIQSNLGYEETIWNKTRTKFRLNTNVVDKEEYTSLMGLLQAYKIYVYDVAKDKGTWCVLTNNTINGVGNKSHKANHINIELIENKYQIA